MVKPAAARGFSLIEILVVLIVVVIITTLVTLNINTNSADKNVEESLQRLVSTAAYALDEAQFSGAEFGALWVETVDRGGDTVLELHWRQRLPEGWRPIAEDDEVFSTMRFPADAVYLLSVADNETLPWDAAAAAPTSGVAPQWLFFSSGETQPGELSVRDRDSGDRLWRLSWDLLGRFDFFRGDSQVALADELDAR